jgi:3-hydroxyisobutyrate dehydrogenase-like beta-hydroxyacid dehydrogenase
MVDVPKLAVVGVGRMGGAMAGRLREAGFPVVVFNRTRSKAEATAGATGAKVAETPREAAAGADVVMTSLADDAAVEQAFLGSDGIAAGVRAKSVVLEMSTIDPATVRRIRPAVEDRGAALLDSPVSGSVSSVEQGQLLVMVGGDAKALDRARTVLDALAARVLHVGPSGTGATMKLAVNDIIHGLNQALSEALVLAERAGVERSIAYEVFASGAAAAPFVLYKRAAFEQPDDTPVAFRLDLVGKDLDLILRLAERVGLDMHQARTNRDVVGEALRAGMAERDISAIAAFLRRNQPQ